jgi:hypothetical protein
MLDRSDLAIAAVVVALRVLVPLLIPRYPLPAIIAATVLDAVDQTVLQAFTDLPLFGYQAYDKALDIYYLAVAYLATFRSWTSLDAFAASQVLFHYRLIGVTLFELFGLRWLLLVFANTFEYVFILHEAVRTRWNPLRLSRTAIVLAIALVWIVIKLPQEWFIHVARLDVTDLLKEALGFPLTAPWGAVLAGSLPAVAGLLAALGVIAIVARVAARRWAPRPDWPFTLDAERHADDVSDDEARAAALAHARKLVDRELFGKIVLVSLISIVFAQILPGVRATEGQLALGVAFVVVVNTAFSESLLRRGFSWSSTVVEFATMGAVNLIGAVGFELFFPVELGAIDLGLTLFFVLLLTLIVTLYDRFRPYYLARRLRAQAAAATPPPTAAAPPNRA